MPSSAHIIRPYHVRTILAAAVVAALAFAPASRAGASPSVAGKAAGPSGTLAVVIGYEPASLDPAVDYDTGGNTYLGNVYEGLVRAVGERQVKIVPDLATSWQQSPDGKTWTFHLRPHVKFHDGSPVDAAAVKFSFDRMLQAKQGAYADFSEITRVEVVNPLTVRFHLQYPFASFLPALACLDGADIVSPKTVGNHKIAPNGTSYLNDHDAGSGPYMLASYQHHQKIVLKAFPGYWRGWSGHHAATVTIEWPASSSTQRLELERGGIDATMNLSSQDFAAVAQESGIGVIERTAQTIRDIRINTTRGALRNKLVRQALSYAFDYEGVIRGVFQGHAARMRGVGPTGFENFVPAPHLYTFDLNKAKSLLAKAGYGGKKLSFTIAYLPDDTQAIQMAQIFQADLAKIGVTAKLQGIPIATYTQVIQKPSTDPQIWIGAWTMDYNDDAQEYWSYFYSKNVPPIGSNVFFYSDPTTDRQLLQARKATDMGKAYRLYQQICNRVYDQAIEIWPVQPNERVALRANVHGYQYNYLYSSYYYPLYDMYRS
jgi:peptide/nickel transport system substrate-binding protein